MLKEEKILKDKFGTANHFTVPEGYLPAPEPQVIEMRAASWWSRLPLRKIAVAASVAAVVGLGSLFFTHQQASQQPEMAHVNLVERVSSNDENRSFDVMADYAMIDNQDIYASLAAGL